MSTLKPLNYLMISFIGDIISNERMANLINKTDSRFKK